MKLIPRNYNTKTGLPFVRFDVQSIVSDPVTGIATITYSERTALKSSDGVTQFIAGSPILRSFSLKPADMATSIDYIDLVTGAHLPAKTTYGTVMAGIIAAIRADQEKMDAAMADAAAQLQTPA